MKYRNRVRSRISNLKDPKNPNLRRNVLCGAILPGLIARMTAEVRSGARGPRPLLEAASVPEGQQGPALAVQVPLHSTKKKNPCPAPWTPVPAPPAPRGSPDQVLGAAIGTQLPGGRAEDGGLVPLDGFEPSEQEQPPAGTGQVMDHGGLHPGLCRLAWRPPGRP